MNELLAKVREMRLAQQAYFRNKQYNTLVEAKRLEREVDRLLLQQAQYTDTSKPCPTCGFQVREVERVPFQFEE